MDNRLRVTYNFVTLLTIWSGCSRQISEEFRSCHYLLPDDLYNRRIIPLFRPCLATRRGKVRGSRTVSYRGGEKRRKYEILIKMIYLCEEGLELLRETSIVWSSGCANSRWNITSVSGVSVGVSTSTILHSSSVKSTCWRSCLTGFNTFGASSSSWMVINCTVVCLPLKGFTSDPMIGWLGALHLAMCRVIVVLVWNIDTQNGQVYVGWWPSSSSSSFSASLGIDWK